MRTNRRFASVVLCLLASSAANALPGFLTDWETTYGGSSSSGATAGCQLCHANANGGSPWNAYGWDLRLALDEAACDSDNSGGVSPVEALRCVELFNSDDDTGEADNLSEILASSQPGWSLGACNTHYDDGGTDNGVTAPAGIGDIDPAGTTPVTGCDTGPGEPPGPGGQIVTVKPGDSIQAALDAAGPNSTILIEPGVYTEPANETNGLNVTQSGISIIGMAEGDEGVVFERTGNQRNGIVVVPSNRTECMGCHETMAPPFTLLPGVPPGFGDPTPVIHDFEIRNITIRNFVNNGLFTEKVGGFKIVNVHSVDNKNYGIFPTISSDGLVQHSSARGADDSGIWVETSTRVRIADNYAEGNVNGFEFSNSNNLIIENNEAFNNTVGMSLFNLTDLVDEVPGTHRLLVRNNYLHSNNKSNTGTPGSLLSFLPSGLGLLILAVDDSIIENNVIEDNNFFGIAMVDYCLALQGTDFDCNANPPPPEFDPIPERNKTRGNLLTNNGTDPDLTNPFFFAAADITLFVFNDYGNCWQDNTFTTYFGLIPQRPCGPLGTKPLFSGRAITDLAAPRR